MAGIQSKESFIYFYLCGSGSIKLRLGTDQIFIQILIHNNDCYLYAPALVH